PSDNTRLRLRYKRWARTLLLGHGLLAFCFIVSGHWFLMVIFTIGTQYCAWLGFLCGLPQHYGMQPNSPDFRYNTRTFTCAWLPAFLYWNMQYHVEHHMYPAVPFFNLPKLREKLAHDLPPAPHGLRATWKEMIEIKRRLAADKGYQFIPVVPDKQ
ncbi:MAG: fatty acid desaturase, partial [Pseudomonadales bacterium]|nr:fatty acid desaturase [Pseudomonadales bacterium]